MLMLTTWLCNSSVSYLKKNVSFFFPGWIELKVSIGLRLTVHQDLFPFVQSSAFSCNSVCQYRPPGYRTGTVNKSEIIQSPLTVLLSTSKESPDIISVFFRKNAPEQRIYLKICFAAEEDTSEVT